MVKTQAFVTLIANKEYFASKPLRGLIHPIKNHLEKISTIIIDNVRSIPRELIHINQCENTMEAIHLFKDKGKAV